MERLYMAYASNGRDRIQFTFYSKHRANSKQNMEDASAAYKRNHGYRPSIICTMILPCDYSGMQHCN